MLARTPKTDYRTVGPCAISSASCAAGTDVRGRGCDAGDGPRRSGLRADYRGRAPDCTWRHGVALGCLSLRQVNRKTPDAAEIANVVVFVKDAPMEPGLSATRASIAQRDESFVPRVTAVTRGSIVEFPNFDPYFHNVFSLSRGATFDLGRFRKGEKRERAFPHAGVIKVYCHIHSEMAATILVFDHRLYATPSLDGTFAIEAVPPGSYQLSAWHERIGETTKADPGVGRRPPRASSSRCRSWKR